MTRGISEILRTQQQPPFCQGFSKARTLLLTHLCPPAPRSSRGTWCRSCFRRMRRAVRSYTACLFSVPTDQQQRVAKSVKCPPVKRVSSRRPELFLGKEEAGLSGEEGETEIMMMRTVFLPAVARWPCVLVLRCGSRVLRACFLLRQSPASRAPPSRRRDPLLLLKISSL
jgi:hypothetical protein